MRRYEYRCGACGRVDEHLRPTADRDLPIACSACGKPMERMLSAFLPTGPTPIYTPPGGAPPPPPQEYRPPPKPKRYG